MRIVERGLGGGFVGAPVARKLESGGDAVTAFAEAADFAAADELEKRWPERIRAFGAGVRFAAEPGKLAALEVFEGEHGAVGASAFPEDGGARGIRPQKRRPGLHAVPPW